MTAAEIAALPDEELSRCVRNEAVKLHNAGTISDDTYIGVLSLATNGPRWDREQWLIWALAAGETH